MVFGGGYPSITRVLGKVSGVRRKKRKKKKKGKKK